MNAMLMPLTQKIYRLVDSIFEDICRAKTQRKWKLPKLPKLDMTIHHLFWSKQLCY